ncbi:hypothetical protein DFH27DRAFT_228999 [Peziza echinospora]|nr:hypothetical protein DFH27DRAFT_228999 [Peziza echinospora]
MGGFIQSQTRFIDRDIGVGFFCAALALSVCFLFFRLNVIYLHLIMLFLIYELALFLGPPRSFLTVPCILLFQFVTSLGEFPVFFHLRSRYLVS